MKTLIKAQCKHSDTGLCYSCFKKECKNESSDEYTVDELGLNSLKYFCLLLYQIEFVLLYQQVL